jgi:hypothetical protein
LAVSFQLAGKRVMACSKRATLSKLLRRMACAVIRPNQRSTRLSHEAVKAQKGGRLQYHSHLVQAFG